MRFLLVLAPLLLLIQLLASEASNESPENPKLSTNKYEQYSVEELETRLSLHKGNQKTAQEKYDAANEILLNYTTEAKRLNETYEEKKKEWDRLVAEENEFENDQELLDAVEMELDEAQANVTAIKKRPQNFIAANKELSDLERTEPTKSLVDLQTDFNKKEAAYEPHRITLESVYERIEKNKCNNPDKSKHGPDCAYHRRRLRPHETLRPEFEAAKKALEERQLYDSKYEKLKGEIQKLKDANDAMDVDLPLAQEIEDKLKLKKEPIELRVNKTRDYIASEAITMSQVAKKLYDVEKAIKKTKEKVTDQQKVVKDLKNNLDDENATVNALKMVYDKKNESGVKSAGFETWMIAVIVAVLVIIVVVVVSIVLWRKKKHLKEGRTNMNNLAKGSNVKSSKSKEKTGKSSRVTDKETQDRSVNQTRDVQPQGGDGGATDQTEGTGATTGIGGESTGGTTAGGITADQTTEATTGATTGGE